MDQGPSTDVLMKKTENQTFHDTVPLKWQKKFFWLTFKRLYKPELDMLLVLHQDPHKHFIEKSVFVVE
jgi:hypothetical protein